MLYGIDLMKELMAFISVIHDGRVLDDYWKVS
jgi:hypothetical protein